MYGRMRARGLVAAAASAVLAGLSAPASADDSYHWGTNGSGACLAIDSHWNSFTPMNCIAVVGPWWAFDGYAHISSKYILCTQDNFTGLQIWNVVNSPGGYADGRPGIAYQTTDDNFTWDGAALTHMNMGSPGKPGNGGIALDNWNPATRHVQGAAGCLAGANPTRPSGKNATTHPKVAYDFGSWETVIGQGKTRAVVKQVMLEEGKPLRFRLVCPKGMERTGGVRHGVGHAMKQRPDDRTAAKTDVAFSASPLRRGATVTLKPYRLPYPSVVQLSLECARKP